MDFCLSASIVVPSVPSDSESFLAFLEDVMLSLAGTALLPEVLISSLSDQEC